MSDESTSWYLDPNHWLLGEGVHHVPSPNYNARPPGTVIDLVVVHGISLPPGEFGGPYIDALFSNALDPKAHPAFASLEGLRVSAHALVRRGGEVVQYVSFAERAWHAGRSSFQGRVECNDYAVGIELEGTDTTPYTSRQYEVLAHLIRVLQDRWPSITRERITGHRDVAPGRKTDPGPAFSWEALYRCLDEVYLRSFAGVQR